MAKPLLADKALAVRSAGVDLLAASHLADDQLVALADDPDPLLALHAAMAVRLRPDLAAKVVARGITAPEWMTRAGIANQLVAAVGKAKRRARSPTSCWAMPTSTCGSPPRVDAFAHAGEADAAAQVFAGVADDAQAAADLAELGDPRGVERLTALVVDQKRSAEQRAAAAEAHRFAHRVSPGLVAALADPNAVVRVAAAATLGALAK